MQGQAEVLELIKQPQDCFIISAKQVQYIRKRFRKVKHLSYIISKAPVERKKKNKRHHSLLLLWKALIPCSMSFPSQMQHTKTRRRHELLPNWPIFFSSFTNHVNKDKTHLIFIEKTQFPLSKVRSRPRSPGGESPPDLFTEMPRRGFLRDPPCKSLKLHCPTKSWDKLTPLSKRGCQAFIFPPLSADAGAE